MLNGANSSLNRKAFRRAMLEAEALDDPVSSAQRFSALGRSWLTAVSDGAIFDVRPAVECFKKAVQRCDRHLDESRWISDQYHLGAAYLMRIPVTPASAALAVAQFQMILLSNAASLPGSGQVRSEPSAPRCVTWRSAIEHLIAKL